jgi:hypothetical protein
LCEPVSGTCQPDPANCSSEASEYSSYDYSSYPSSCDSSECYSSSSEDWCCNVVTGGCEQQ